MGKLYVLPQGGFGNILFIALAGWSLAKKYGLELVFISNYASQRKTINNYVLYQKFELANISQQLVPQLTQIKEAAFKYSPLPVLNQQQNYLLTGYFQSWKYSRDYLSEVKDVLFKDPMMDRVTKYYQKYAQDSTTVMLHVRRGDYLQLQDIHPPQTDLYYRTALELLDEKVGDYTIFVFSDDLEYVANWKLLADRKRHIVELGVEESFMLMTMCDHYVIANSSLSLLGYYFRNNAAAEICFPSNWFGPKGPEYSREDLIEMTSFVHVI